MIEEPVRLDPREPRRRRRSGHAQLRDRANGRRGNWGGELLRVAILVTLVVVLAFVLFPIRAGANATDVRTNAKFESNRPAKAVGPAQAAIKTIAV